MRNGVLLMVLLMLFVGCVPPSVLDRSYATVLYVEYSEPKRLDRLNIEMFLDDGRIFVAKRYKTNMPFMIGDRVLIEYRYVDVKKIHLIDSMPREDIWDDD